MPPVDRNNPKRAASSESQYSLMEFNRDFPDDATCLEWLWRNRYAGDGKHADCPKCEQRCYFKRYETTQQRQSWTCTSCGHHIHPTAGTIFHKSSTSLHLWFYAMYLMTSTRCGISAKQLERELGVTYKTAWRMANLIRNELMEQDSGPLTGKVEVDETWVGGKRRVATAGVYDNKTPVMGLVERKGQVRAFVVPDSRGKTLVTEIGLRVLPRSIIYTDEYAGYNRLQRRGYVHRRVHHAAKVYVDGDKHTNTIEGFWSLVKRGIDSVYHAVSAKHLQGYLNEYAWRYNGRRDPRGLFELVLRRAVS